MNTAPTAKQVGRDKNPTASQLQQQALKRILRPVRLKVLAAQILATISAILSIAPYMALVSIGEHLLSSWTNHAAIDGETLRVAVTVLLVSFIAKLMIHSLAVLFMHFADAELVATIRHDLLRVLDRAPLSWFTSNSTGRVRKAVQDDVLSLHLMVAHAPVETTAAIITPIALGIYAFTIDSRLGLLAIATLPIYLLIYAIMMRDMPAKTVEMDQKLGTVASTMAEFARGITVVKAFGLVGKSFGNYRSAANDFNRFYLEWAGPMTRASAIGMAMVSVPILLLVNIGGGVALAAAGIINPVQLLTTTLIALIIPHAVEVVGNSSFGRLNAAAAASRLCELLDTPTMSEITESEAAQIPAGNRVEFTGVSFSYGQVRAADDITFTLPEGTVTALVGPSGSGKSTVATLLARFNDPDAGEITIGGVNLRNISRAELYRQVAFVLQNAQLLRTSIRENIALGKPEASLEEVREAARTAYIDDFVMSLPDGYDTVIGEGLALSGGQEQRIAIARALLMNAPVLVMDEATALTDPESEDEIQQALNALVTGRTVLVIAHRPASVRGVDQIIVLENGKVAARGTHAELADNAHYQRIWQVADIANQPVQEAEK